MDNQTLTVEQAFDAMRYFLEQFNEREHSESIELLLHWTARDVWADGGTNDPAQRDDWLGAVQRAVGEM